MVNIVPPAPPPYQPPQRPSVNPYEFITSGAQPAPKSLLGGGPKQRLLVVIVGVVVLFMVVALFAALLGGGGSESKDTYLKLLQQQSQLITVSGIGTQNAHSTQAQNLAATVQLSLKSEQSGLTALAKKAGASTDPVSIAAGTDKQIAATLNTAIQNNNFDDVFIQTTQSLLASYQKTIKQLYEQAQTTSGKATLLQAYNNTQQLLPKDDTQTPTTN